MSLARAAVPASAAGRDVVVVVGRFEPDDDVSSLPPPPQAEVITTTAPATTRTFDTFGVLIDAVSSCGGTLPSPIHANFKRSRPARPELRRTPAVPPRCRCRAARPS